MTSKKCPQCGTTRIQLRKAVHFRDSEQSWQCEEGHWWTEPNGTLASEMDWTGRRDTWIGAHEDEPQGREKLLKEEWPQR